MYIACLHDLVPAGLGSLVIYEHELDQLSHL